MSRADVAPGLASAQPVRAPARRPDLGARRNLLLRLGTAAILLPPLALLLRAGGLWSAGLMAVAALLGAREYLRMVLGLVPVEATPALLAAAGLPLLPALLGSRATPAAFWLLASASLASWLLHLARGHIERAPERVGYGLGAALFVGVGLFALASLRALPHGWPWSVAVVAGTWLNDAGAYFGGRLLGRRKLAPKVSPGKTWEGLACGALTSTASVLAVRALLFPELGWAGALWLSAGLAVFGPLGDLCKSLLKRSAGVKDSGRLLPGHGGVLDRIDALLFNAVFALAYATLAGPA